MPSKDETVKTQTTSAQPQSAGTTTADGEIVRTYQNADGTVAVDATEAEFAETYEEQGYRLVVDPNTDPAEAQAAAQERAAKYAEKSSSGEPNSEVDQSSPSAKSSQAARTSNPESAEKNASS
jgi:hypothetical protein